MIRIYVNVFHSSIQVAVDRLIVFFEKIGVKNNARKQSQILKSYVIFQ